MVDQERTTALGLFHYAHSYAASAYALSKADVRATHSDAPVRFLYRHAAELYLKAFLLVNGEQPDVLKNRFGHKLKALTTAAISKGLIVGGYLQHLLSLLDDPLADRYLEIGVRTVLSDQLMFGVCVYLHSQTGPLVYAQEGLTRSPPTLERDDGDASIFDAEIGRVLE